MRVLKSGIIFHSHNIMQENHKTLKNTTKNITKMAQQSDRLKL